RRFASAGITLAIVLMLLLSGPAGAVKLHIDLDEAEVEQGDSLKFTVTSEIESRDSYVPIENYSVKISNREKSFFIDFDQHGKPIGDNSDIISVNPVSNNNDNGYGYGYGNRYGYDHIGYGYGYNFGYGYGYG
ncbi:MAG: hypothetical protein PHD26_06965, partial [Methanosarcinaceae archaeon]|nr:hypothetical protein [Methanosarcinaceae archaeon]